MPQHSSHLLWNDARHANIAFPSPIACIFFYIVIEDCLGSFKQLDDIPNDYGEIFLGPIGLYISHFKNRKMMDIIIGVWGLTGHFLSRITGGYDLYL